MLRLEALTPEARDLSPALCAALEGTGFVLAGGTGLALQLGHRISGGFRLVLPARHLPLRSGGPVECAQTPNHHAAGSDRYCGMSAGDRALHIHCLPAGLWAARRAMAREAHAPIEDIGAMKLVTVSQRGAKKDFYDLYAILREWPLARIVERLRTIRAMYTDPPPNPTHIAKSLVYFHDAEQDPKPRLLIPTS